MAGLVFSFQATAQSKTESFQVSGNCGMCKNTIEKAAKKAGASEASWDKDSKTLTVTYNSSSTNTAKIQSSVARAGYDNAGAKGDDAAYEKLPACCHYDRAAATDAPAKASCCTDKCEMKDGKCADMAVCKEKGCCKDEATCKANGCCGGEHGGAGHGQAMDCCKDGKCSKPGHKGGDCCKKS